MANGIVYSIIPPMTHKIITSKSRKLWEQYYDHALNDSRDCSIIYDYSDQGTREFNTGMNIIMSFGYNPNIENHTHSVADNR